MENRFVERREVIASGLGVLKCWEHLYRIVVHCHPIMRFTMETQWVVGSLPASIDGIPHPDNWSVDWS